MVSINPLIPQSWGIYLNLGDTPRPPAGSILHLFFSGLYSISIMLSLIVRFVCNFYRIDNMG